MWLFNQSNKKKRIDEKNYLNLAICFTRYDCGKSIIMLRLYYHEFFWNSEEYTHIYIYI